MTINYQKDIVKWDHAVELQNNGDFEETLKVYDSVYELTPAHLFNMSQVHVCLGNGNSAIKCLTSAVEKDPYFAVAFFLRGIVHFDANNYSDAIVDFQHTKKLLRGNSFINYRPLGLRYQLQLFEILYNLALARFAKGDIEEARGLLTEAIHDTDVAQRKHITEAFKLLKENKLSLLKPFRISTDKIFVPPKEVTENLARRQSAKGSKLVFTSNKDDNSTSFVGIQRVEQLQETRRNTYQFTSLKLKSSNDIRMKTAVLKRSYSTGSLNTNSRIHVRHYKSSVKQKNKGNNDKNSKLVTSTPTRSDEANESTDVLNTAFNDIEKTPNNTPGDGLTVSEKAEATTEKFNPQPEQETVAKTLKGYRSFKRASHRASIRSKTLYGREGFSRSMSDIVRRKQHKTQESLQFYSNRSTDNPAEIKDIPLIEPVIRLKTSFKSRKKQSLKITEIGDFNVDFVDGHQSVVMSGGQLDYSAHTKEVCKDRGPEAVHSTQTTDRNTTVAEKSAVEEKPALAKQRPSFKRRKTLGSVFGDKSTAVKYALTEACNVLTAFVTPIVDESEIQATSVLLKNHRKSSSAMKSIPAKQGGQIFDRGKTKSIKKKRAPDPPKPFIGQSLLAVSNLLTSIIDQDVKEIKTEDHKSNNAKLVDLGENICSEDAVPITDDNRGPQSNSNDNVRLETEDITEDFRIRNKVGMSASLDAWNKELDQSKAISFELETEITKNPADNLAVSNLHVIAENASTNEKLDNQHDQTLKLVGDPTIELTNNELYIEPMKMEVIKPHSVNKSAKCKSAKVPPDYPPPPLRLSYKKNKNAGQKKEQNSKVKEQTRPKAVGSALFAAGKTVSAISTLGTTLDPFATSTFEEAERLHFEASKHDYVNVGRLNESADVNVDYVNITNLHEAEETDVGNVDNGYVNVGRRSEDDILRNANADEDLTIAKEYYANWNKRSNDVLEVPHQFNHDCNEDCHRRIETREIELHSRTFITTCQLLGDFVNSSKEITDAFKAFIQSENNNNNLVWCLEGHLRNVDERTIQSKSHDYINVNQFAKLNSRGTNF